MCFTCARVALRRGLCRPCRLACWMEGTKISRAPDESDLLGSGSPGAVHFAPTLSPHPVPESANMAGHTGALAGPSVQALPMARRVQIGPVAHRQRPSPAASSLGRRHTWLCSASIDEPRASTSDAGSPAPVAPAGKRVAILQATKAATLAVEDLGRPLGEREGVLCHCILHLNPIKLTPTPPTPPTPTQPTT